MGSLTHWILVLTLISLLIGCATSERRTPPLSYTILSSDPTIPPGVDYFGLQRSLNMERPAHQLGYTETRFNTCQAGNGYSRQAGCRMDTLTVVHFQLLCRPRDGTVQAPLQRSDLTPIADRRVRWKLGTSEGVLALDREGYGRIVMTSQRSPRLEHLTIQSDGDYMIARAGEINRVVTPTSWCRR